MKPSQSHTRVRRSDAVALVAKQRDGSGREVSNSPARPVSPERSADFTFVVAIGNTLAMNPAESRLTMYYRSSFTLQLLNAHGASKKMGGDGKVSICQPGPRTR